eukprot:4780150-Pleurochrysis_carterae.AAC.2
MPNLPTIVYFERSIAPAYAVLSLAIGALSLLLRPLYSSIAGLAIRADAQPLPQARRSEDNFCDATPFESALNSTLRPAASLFAEARLLSTALTLLLAAAYAYMTFGARVLRLSH